MPRITINEQYLQRIIVLFDEYESESEVMKYGPLSQDLGLKVGGPGFAPGVHLKAAAKLVQANFLERATMFCDQTGSIGYGIRQLLENSDRIESLNDLSAAEFADYVEEASNKGGAPAPSSTGGEAA